MKVEYVKELMDGSFLVVIDGNDYTYTIEELQELDDNVIEQIENFLGL